MSFKVAKEVVKASLVFGTQIEDYSTFYSSTFALLRTILGDFDFNALETANRILGPIFFITYVFFVFFVLLNMFLAIINDSYVEVKMEMKHSRSKKIAFVEFLSKVGHHQVVLFAISLLHRSSSSPSASSVFQKMQTLWIHRLTMTSGRGSFKGATVMTVTQPRLVQAWLYGHRDQRAVCQVRRPFG